MRSEPLVTVLTPVYNGDAFIAECIESVLAQTYRNYEYIIVNNRSTDRTLEIASAYVAKDPRIRVHNNEEFLPVIANHNHAFNLTSPESKYCKVVSADDSLGPECIARMVGLAEDNPTVGIVGTYQLCGRHLKWQGLPYPKAVFSGPEICRHFFLLQQTFLDRQPIYGFGSPTSLLYRADLIRESKGNFYPNPSPHSDSSACFKSLRNCDYGFVYQVLCYEKTHRDTQSSKSGEMNRYLSASLNDLIQYGPWYLSEQEFESQVQETVSSYHQFLAVNYFLGFRNKEFWTYHEGRLKELGYPLKPFTLAKAAVRTGLHELINPGQAIGKAWRHFRGVPRRTLSGAPQ